MLFLALALAFAVAVWRSRDPLSQTLDVERGLRWWFALMALSGWGILLYRTYTRDAQYERMFEIAWSVSQMGAKMGLETEGALRALREMEGRFPVVMEQDSASPIPLADPSMRAFSSH